MDFRTKFIFTFVAVALGSMLALGAFTYDAVRDRLRALALRQLDAVAEGKKQDLERVITAWRDRVQLLANVPRMRDGLPLLPDEADEAVPVIEAILRDALGSSRALRGITLVITRSSHQAQLLSRDLQLLSVTPWDLCQQIRERHR